MNEEIKEILDEIRDSYYETQPSTKFYKNIKAIEDYITNLHEELKSAKESITWWSNRYKALQNRNIELVLEKDRLKENNNAMQEEMAMTWKKLDKAREILKAMKHCELLIGGRNKSNVDKLLNILQGDDKNVKD